MRIRDVQIATLMARAEETFPRRVRDLLAERLSEHREALQSDVGLHRVEALIVEAREHGFQGQRDVCKYVALSFVTREGFTRDLWAAAVLADPHHQTPTDRIEALWRTAKQRALDEAVSAAARALG